MKRYDIVSNGKKVSKLSIEPFALGLRNGISESKRMERAVFIENEDVIHAMSYGSEFNRLCESADLVGVYRHGFSAEQLREDLNNTLRGG